MTTETKRDLQADLALCESVRVVYYDEGGGYQADYPDDGPRHYFEEADEGWAHAIRRAIAAEAEVEQLREILGYIYQKERNDCAMWDGKMCVGLPVFQDRVYARKLVRDLGPILFPEVTADAS